MVYGLFGLSPGEAGRSPTWTYHRTASFRPENARHRRVRSAPRPTSDSRPVCTSHPKSFVKLNMVMRTWAGRRAALATGWRAAKSVLTRRHMETLGQALIGRLRLAIKQAGVPLWLNTAMESLITDDDDCGGGCGGRAQRPHCQNPELPKAYCSPAAVSNRATRCVGNISRKTPAPTTASVQSTTLETASARDNKSVPQLT